VREEGKEGEKREEKEGKGRREGELAVFAGEIWYKA